MGHTWVMDKRVLYSEQRPYVVADSLELLLGPTDGVVELPMRLDWSEQRSYDLADARQLNLMYERVLREATHVEDLRRYLNGPKLRAVWRRLFLPQRVRSLWEDRFPELANAN